LVRIGGALFFLFENVSRGVTLETFLGSNNSKTLPEEVIANSPLSSIGQQFALTEMGYTIVRLLQRFERVENHMHGVDGGSPCLKAEIVLQPGQGVRVSFFEGEKGEK
jgi:hypothetical protein